MADTEVLTPAADLPAEITPDTPTLEEKQEQKTKDEKAETPIASEDSPQSKQKNTERNGNRQNKPQNQTKRKDTTIKDLISAIPQFADISSLEKEVSELSRYANGLPGKLVPANAPQKPIGPVKQSFIRATEVASGVIQKYNGQSKQLETLKSNESVLQQLATEYTDTFSTYESLISQLETLVEQLSTENTGLKKLLQSHNIPIPVQEKVENKPAAKQNSQKKDSPATKKSEQPKAGAKNSPAGAKKAPEPQKPADQPAAADGAVAEKPKNSPQAGNKKNANQKANKAKADAASPTVAPASEGDKPKNSPQPKKANNKKENPPANSESKRDASADASADKPGNIPKQQKNKKQSNKPAEPEKSAESEPSAS